MYDISVVAHVVPCAHLRSRSATSTPHDDKARFSAQGFEKVAKTEQTCDHTESPMPPRRGHTKSRTGCGVCKRRRVKCDETRPECSNCIKHGVSCDYMFDPDFSVAETPASHCGAPVEADMLSLLSFEIMTATAPSSLVNDWNVIRSETPDASLSIRAPTNVSSVAMESKVSSNFPGALSASQLSSYLSQLQLLKQPSPDPELSFIDLKLMHQFTVSTATSTSHRSEVQKVWACEVPQLAHRDKYLMHSLLGAAALHLAAVTDSTDLLPRAAAHHQAAVRGIVAELGSINAENCHSLFAAQMIMHLFELCWSRLQERQACSSTSSNLSSSSQHSLTHRSDDVQLGRWVHFIRCTFGFLEKCWMWLPLGPWQPMMHAPTTYTTPDPASESRLAELFQLCMDRALPGSEELNDTTTGAAYYVAITNLRPVYAAVHAAAANPDDIRSAVFLYVIKTPARFWDALEEGRPRALIIYAHYCIMLEEVKFWWTQGQAGWDLERVERRLPPEWRSWLEWPWQRLRREKHGSPPGGNLVDIAAAQNAELGMTELLTSPLWL